MWGEKVNITKIKVKTANIIIETKLLQSAFD